jgi:hypothetical protein
VIEVDIYDDETWRIGEAFWEDEGGGYEKSCEISGKICIVADFALFFGL